MDVLYYLTDTAAPQLAAISARFPIQRFFTSLLDVSRYLLTLKLKEQDTSHVLLLFYHTPEPLGMPQALEQLFFNRNLVVVAFAAHVPDLEALAATVAQSHVHLKDRLLRLVAFHGLVPDPSTLGAVPTVCSVISGAIHHNVPVQEAATALADMWIKELDVREYLGVPPPREQHLIRAVGLWNFPAHLLNCNELQLCAAWMITHAARACEAGTWPLDFNGTLAFCAGARLTYRAGNPFHNFRHAVDVLQATFYFLIRLGCLPEFAQYTAQKQELETPVEYTPADYTHVRSVADVAMPVSSLAASPLVLLAEESLSLLVAALGHDAGHPGTTNAFVIKHRLPLSLVYNEMLVFENYHCTVFHRVRTLFGVAHLGNHLRTSPHLVRNTILATDMAHHFEYVDKVRGLTLGSGTLSPEERLLVCDLLIKCADILNVLRPLNLSALWGVALSREFDQVAKLELRLAGDLLVMVPDYPPLPTTTEAAVAMFGGLGALQQFFINTFAAGLFQVLGELFPQLRYATQFVESNKLFWDAKQ